MSNYSKRFKKGDKVIIDEEWAKEMNFQNPYKERIVYDAKLWGDVNDGLGGWLTLNDVNCPEKFLSLSRVANTELARFMYPDYEVTDCGKWLKRR